MRKAAAWLCATDISPHFRRDLKVMLLANERDDSYAVLCSTDLEQPADEIVRFYRLRYQTAALSDRVCHPRRQGVEPIEIMPVGAAGRP